MQRQTQAPKIRGLRRWFPAWIVQSVCQTQAPKIRGLRRLTKLAFAFKTHGQTQAPKIRGLRRMGH